MKLLTILFIYTLLFSCSKAPEGSSSVVTNISFQTAKTLYYPHLRLVNLETGEEYIQRINPSTMGTFVPFATDIFTGSAISSTVNCSTASLGHPDFFGRTCI